jgi:hypothetical protein
LDSNEADQWERIHAVIRGRKQGARLRPAQHRRACRLAPYGGSTLADLRNAFHADVKARVIAEINKDLTKHPVDEIETHLTAA